MISIKKLKSIKGLSAYKLPKIERIIICPDRKDYMNGSRTSHYAIKKAFGYNHNVVYVLWDENLIVYVGQSKNILLRLQSHKTRINYTHVSMLNFDNSESMAKVEVQLIQKHKPKFNKRHNPDYGYSLVNYTL